MATPSLVHAHAATGPQVVVGSVGAMVDAERPDKNVAPGCLAAPCIERPCCER